MACDTIKDLDAALGIRIQNSSENDEVIQLAIGTGSFIYRCEPWNGVYLWLNQIKDRILPAETTAIRYVTINYCLSGRCEVRLPDDTYIYMKPGMLSIDVREPVDGYYYPTGNYVGLELAFDLDTLEQNSPESLTDYGDVLGWIARMTEENGGSCSVYVSDSCRERIQTVCANLMKRSLSRQAYRYQTLSLLVQLMSGGVIPIPETDYVTKGQRRIVTQAERKITADLSVHYTIRDLAKEYGISASSLKLYFEKVYGMPISCYLRDMRIAYAQQLLQDTTMKIGSIAAACGYSHQGKFGTVFRQCTGMTPLEYRRLNYRSEGEENNSETQ